MLSVRKFLQIYWATRVVLLLVGTQLWQTPMPKERPGQLPSACVPQIWTCGRRKRSRVLVAMDEFCRCYEMPKGTDIAGWSVL